MEAKRRRYYVTTAIPYVNADPHIGFALELVQADVVARAYREQAGADNVRFVTGTDENAIKNVQAAEKAGVPIADFVEENAERFKTLLDEKKGLNISNDDFIRTTEARHEKGAQKLWKACAHDLYPKEYEGLYCIGCEQFYLEKDLVDGLCPEHKTKPERVKENNYFFKLSKYEKFLKDAFASGRIRIHPNSRRNETINFIEQGLEDFSASRSNERAKNWGVDVPDDPSQKMYVWFDALSNYINALGYGDDAPDFRKFWLTEDVNIIHVIGKGITRFHAIYWPAILESAGIFPPGGLDIFVHGYVTVGGEKMSKTTGNVIDPFALISTYGTDAVRYFLLREIPTFEDGDFTIEKLERRYSGELANTFGNLVQRVVTLAEKHKLENVSSADDHTKKYLQENKEAVLRNLVELRLQRALTGIEVIAINANQYVDEQKPWEKSGKELERTLANLSLMVLVIADLLSPFLPATAEKVYEYFGVTANEELKTDTRLRIRKSSPLFPRLS